VQAILSSPPSARRQAISLGLLAALAGAGLFETTEIWDQHRELAVLSAQLSRLSDTRGTLRHEQAAVSARLTAARASAPAAPAHPAPPAGLETAIADWLARVERLKQLPAQRPELGFAELELLSEKDWFTAAKDVKFEEESDLKKKFQELRETARRTLARLLHAGSASYAAAHGDQLPASMEQIAAAMDRPLSPALLRRFEVTPHGPWSLAGRDEPLIAEKTSAAQDSDSRVVITNTHYEVEDLTTVSDRELRLALRAYVAANPGRLPEGPDQLVSYLKTPPRTAALKSFLAKPAGDFRPEELKKLLPPE
jgi:hypothetical protein